MQVQYKKKSKHGQQHSNKYYQDIENARRQIQMAEENMKKMDAEERAFHEHMAQSMHQLMQTFSSGYSALEHAKLDEKMLNQEEKEQLLDEDQ